MLKTQQHQPSALIQASTFPWKGYWRLLIVLSFLLSAIWGLFPNAETFLSLQFAQAISNSYGLEQLLINNNIWHISPLHTILWAAVSWLNLPLTIVAIIFSALGWGIASVASSRLLQEIGYFAIAVLTPLLLLLSPWFFLSIASHVVWILVVGWLAFMAALQQQDKKLLLYSLLLFAISISWITLSLSLILFAWLCMQKRTMLWKSSLVLLIPFALTLFILVWQTTRPFATIATPTNWWNWWQTLTNTSELFWLLIPLTFIAIWRQPHIRPLAFWAGLSLIAYTSATQIIIAVNLTLLATIGIAELSRGVVRLQKIELPDQQARFVVGAILFIPLLWAFIEWDAAAYAQRPIAISQLEKEVGHWIKTEAEPTDLIWSSARAGFIANQPTFVWNGRPGNQADLAILLKEISKNPPQYIISQRTAVWQAITNLGWFKDRYVQIHQVTYPNEPTAPFIIWQYQPDDVLNTAVHPVNVTLENGAKLVGYQQWPQAINPGEAVHLALHWQKPITRAFITVAWLPGPLGDTNEALRDMLTPRAIPPNWIQEEQIITEQIVLTTTEKINIGGYQINLSFREQNSFEKMPLYRDGDENPLDRIQLGYVAVPWQQQIPASAQRANITFANNIQLVAVDQPPSAASRNDQLAFTLYWQTKQQPEANYTVFLQLLNEQGELIASGDGLPMGGQYATRAWLPNHTIPDTHFIMIPEGIPSGSYRVKTGLYLAETGERLPALDASENPLADHAYTIMSIEVE